MFVITRNFIIITSIIKIVISENFPPTTTDYNINNTKIEQNQNAAWTNETDRLQAEINSTIIEMDDIDRNDQEANQIQADVRRTVPEIVLNSNSGVNLPTKFDKNNNKHIPVTFIQKFSPHNFIRTIAEKIPTLPNLFEVMHHPNFGGIQLLSPQYLWEKLHEKGHHYLTGPLGAVYGLSSGGNKVDYPFAYRKLGNEKIVD